MNKLSNEKTMTIKEVAEILGVTSEAIKKHVRELFPGIISNGKTTYLNEKLVTIIKTKMTPTTQVVGNKTTLEKELIIQQALMFQQEKIQELEKENKIMKPKSISYDTFINSENVHDMSEVAKMFNTGRNKLFDLLREYNVLRANNEPYQQYVDNRYFEVKQKVIQTGQSKAVTKVTSKGIVFIEKLLKKDINKYLPF